MRIERKDEMNITHNSHKKISKKDYTIMYNTAVIKGWGFTSTRHSTNCSQFKEKGVPGIPHFKMAHKKTTPVEMSCKNARPYDWCQKQNGKKDQ